MHFNELLIEGRVKANGKLGEEDWICWKPEPSKCWALQCRIRTNSILVFPASGCFIVLWVGTFAIDLLGAIMPSSKNQMGSI